MTDYCVMYRNRLRVNPNTMRIVVPLKNVRKLAGYLNGFVKRNPDYEVLAVFTVDSKGEHQKNVKFLKSEYESQQWITGYKERLLANAVEVYNMDLKWKSGLKGRQ